MPNKPQTPSQHLGTPEFLACTGDWAFHVALQQRKAIAQAVRNRELPSANELAHVIRVNLIKKRMTIRELIEAARALADMVGDGSSEHARLVAALEVAIKHFGR